jgi:hypothetical protein
MSDDDDEDLPPNRPPQLVRSNAYRLDPCTYGHWLERKRYSKVVNGVEMSVDSNELLCRDIINAKRNNIFTGRVNNINIAEYEYPEHLFKKNKSKGSKGSKATKKSKGTNKSNKSKRSKRSKGTKKSKGIKTKKSN